MAAIPPNSWFGNPRSHSNSRNMIIIAALPLRDFRFHHHQGDTMDSAIGSTFPYLCYSRQSTHNDSKGERRFQFRSFHVLEGLCNVFMGSTSSDKNRNKNLNNKVESFLDASSSRSSRGRVWTNILLAINVVVYIAQITTNGKLMLWGAKINSLIDKGQIWRLATSTFLHANVAHLMVNCFSLNSMGPVVESFGGPSRLLAVYIVSAISSATCSYCLCKSPAVGASGAIFGLVGSFAVYVLRHRNLVGKGNQDLLQIGRVIALNLVIGLLSKGIDNWGHLGGLLGGAALSWLIGPAWTYQRTLADGRAVFADKSPLSQFFGSHKKLR